MLYFVWNVSIVDYLVCDTKIIKTIGLQWFNWLAGHNLLLYQLQVELSTFYFYSSRFLCSLYSYYIFLDLQHFYFYSTRNQIYWLQVWLQLCSSVVSSVVFSWSPGGAAGRLLGPTYLWRGRGAGLGYGRLRAPAITARLVFRLLSHAVHSGSRRLWGTDVTASSHYPQ